MAASKAGFGTRAVHVGHEADPATGAVGPPIYQVSTFLHPRRRDAAGNWVDNQDWIYTRWANPTTQAVERKMASLEGAESSLAFASGMAAISCAILSNVASGQNMVAMADVYGGTFSLLNNQIRSAGIDVVFVRSNQVDDLVRAVTKDTRLVYVETPTNPFNRCVDLKALIGALEDKYGKDRPAVVCDATFASPYNMRPLEAGVDVSVHSATKYLNGHSDVIAGFASGSREAVDRMIPWMRNLGASIDPHQAFLLGRGMRTLPLRMRAHNANAQRVARLLADHEAVENVWHPSLADHPDHDTAKRTMSGYGGIVSFQPRRRDHAAARAFLESLDYFHPAASLGGVESLATIPAETSHSYLSVEELEDAGLSRSFIRLAVGVEDVEDLEADLTRALARLK